MSAEEIRAALTEWLDDAATDPRTGAPFVVAKVDAEGIIDYLIGSYRGGEASEHGVRSYLVDLKLTLAPEQSDADIKALEALETVAGEDPGLGGRLGEGARARLGAHHIGPETVPSAKGRSSLSRSSSRSSNRTTRPFSRASATGDPRHRAARRTPTGHPPPTGRLLALRTAESRRRSGTRSAFPPRSLFRGRLSDEAPGPRLRRTEIFPRILPWPKAGARSGAREPGPIPAIPFLMRSAGYGHGWFRTSDLSRVKRPGVPRQRPFGAQSLL